MRRRNGGGNSHQGIVEYALEDFLEIKANLVRAKSGPLKKYLFRGKESRAELEVIDGLRLADNLILVQKESAPKLGAVVFLNPNSGSIRVQKVSV